ncbi:hypothetical protein M2138_000211 [Dysgonomonadaceae bacterium PH5-43]|nr:hypothetical protein [Dysgonomonadaceae bacterium PH5-43]
MKSTEYIKELIDRYWTGDTSVVEEQEIKTFFSLNNNLPECLEQWRDWFEGESAITNLKLNDDFEKQILAKISSTETKKKPKIKQMITLSIAVAAMFAIAFVLWTDKTTCDYDEISYAEAVRDYETTKEMLYLTSSIINQTKTKVEDNISELKVVKEYIKLK